MELARRRHPAFANVRRVAHVFHVSYEAVDRELPALLERERPDALIMFGLGRRAATHVRIETRARNALTRMVPDAGGRSRSPPPFVAGAPADAAAAHAGATAALAARATGVPVALRATPAAISAITSAGGPPRPPAPVRPGSSHSCMCRPCTARTAARAGHH